MLPFLTPKYKSQEAGTSIIVRKPDNEESEQNQGLNACAQSLIDAIHSKDAKAVAAAFSDMMTMCEPNDDPGEEHSEQDTE